MEGGCGMTAVDLDMEVEKVVDARVQDNESLREVNRQRINVIPSKSRNVHQIMSSGNFFEVGCEIMPTVTFCRHSVAEILLHTCHSIAWGARGRVIQGHCHSSSATAHGDEKRTWF